MILKSKVDMMGTKEDKARRNKLRTDNADRRDKVEQSLDIILNKGRGVDSKAVEDLLQEKSWVPISVSWFNFPTITFIDLLFL